MTEETRANIRKKILFISCMLGIMAGITAYLIYKAVQQQSFSLMAIAPAMLLTSIPMVIALRRLYKLRDRAE